MPNPVLTINRAESDSLTQIARNLVALGDIIHGIIEDVPSVPVVDEPLGILGAVGATDGLDELVERITNRTALSKASIKKLIHDLDAVVSQRNRFAQTLRNVSELATLIIKDVIVPIVM